MSAKNHIELTRLQGGIAIASFSIGALISCVCLFFIQPLGEIASSAIIIVGNFLVLCGGILGVKASTDAKLSQMQIKIDHQGTYNEPTEPKPNL
jgi:hypothetical protein